MIADKYGQLIFNETDLVDLVMRNYDLSNLKKIIVDKSVNIETAAYYLDNVPDLLDYTFNDEQSVSEFDLKQQSKWFMPEEYKQLDIAEYILGLCDNEAELQRVGEELLLYQEKNLFDLLRFLKYLVDVVNENNVIAGVGRGSSVASFVLYKLGVHKINSLYYNLDITEFLR